MFRQIPDEEMFDVAMQIMEVRHTRGILDFARDIYGDGAYQILIENEIREGTDGGLIIHDVEVNDRESSEILPDFRLPYWQAELERFPKIFEDCKTFQEKLDRAREHLRDHDVYSEYELDPEMTYVIVLSELSNLSYPELYRKEN